MLSMGVTDLFGRRIMCTSIVGVSAMSLLLAGCSKAPVETPDEVSASFEISSITPPDSATNVVSVPTIAISFEEPVELLEMASFRLNPPVPGTLELGEQGKTLRYMLEGTLDRSTTYRATLSAGSVGRGDALLGEDISWSFTTSEFVSGALRGSYQSEDGSKRVTAEIIESRDTARTYEMTTTASLRDNDPADGRVIVVEKADQPMVRTGDVMFDALFALSVQEARENSVSSISDGAFNNGQGVPCECFETGAKWNYVWTRDTAYAVDLGLAMLDPERSRKSLEFKLSPQKGQGPQSAQIVQDTGSGGSWPVSSDRVVWAIGAEALLHYLDAPSREAFASRAYTAMKNTAEQDRASIFDARDGLYRGEQSFLDWREQSYPTWTAQDTVHLAMSKTLSTNVGHLRMLRLTQRLADERGEVDEAARYGQWADDLEAAIEAGFWLEDQGLYSSMKLNDLAPHPLRKYDLLGESLAVLSGVPDGARARRVVSSYPHVPMGPAVLWPQQPLIPIYHNRGIWPFVTAYGLFAAQQVGNTEVFDLDLESLIRGAAYNLSNMENFEFTSQEPYYDDGPYSGPVVNSRRQLWSVAGYFGAIAHGVFGVRMGWEGMRITPFITSTMHERYFEGEAQISLTGIAWRGKLIDVHVRLPEQVAMGSGAYTIAAMRKDGEEVDPLTAWSDAALGERSVFEVELAAPRGLSESVTIVSDFEDYTDLWAPREPASPVVRLVDGSLEVEVASAGDGGEQGVVYDIARDGELVARGVGVGVWRDEQSSDHASVTHCYSVMARFVGSGHVSHPSRPICYWGEEGESRIQVFNVENMAASTGGQWSSMHGRPHYQDWGDAGHELVVTAWRPDRSGEHLLQLVYGNGSGGFNTGITAAAKVVVLEDAWSGEELDRKMIAMPQLSDWSSWGESSFVSIQVQADRVYRIRIIDGINMSYFEHFVPYTGGTGGGLETFNRANITQLKILPKQGRPQRGPLGYALDGVDDLAKFEASQRVMPGAPINDWSRWALDWDDHYLYLALVSTLYEEPFKAGMIYIAGDDASAGTRQGIPYSDQVAHLPFDATTAISWRRQNTGDPGEQPWNGVYVYRGGAWERVWGMTREEHVWVSEDGHTISMRIPRELLGPTDTIRVVGHGVNERPGEEWKELFPAAHTPWLEGGGASFEIDLRQGHGQENWSTID